MRGRLAAVLLASSTLVIPAASADSAPGAVTFELIRTTSGPSQFDLSVSASPGPDGVLIGEADTYARSGHVVRIDGGAIVGDNPEAQGLDVGNVHIRTCSYTGTCAPGGFDVVLLGVSYASGSSAGDVNELFFVVRGTRISIRLTAKGWRLRNAPLTFHDQPTQQDAAASAAVAGRGVAVTGGAASPGGRSGSVAVAMPPCSISDVGAVARGAGRVTLIGGVTSPSFTCPATTAPVLASYATSATQWRIDGLVAGDTTLANQALLVIDTPKRVPPGAA